MNTSCQLATLVQRKAISVTADRSLDEVLALMDEARASCVVVVSNTHPDGIFTEQDAVRLVADGRPLHALSVGEVMTRPVFCVPQDMDCRQAYHTMLEHHFRHLVVVDAAGSLAGVVSEGDFVRLVGMEYLVELKTVDSVMTRTVVTLGEADTLAAASRFMADRHLSCIVVIRGETPVGILTERDVVHLAREVDDAGSVLLMDVMKAPVRAVAPDTPLQQAARMMRDAGIRRLVVTREGKLAGLITRHDVAKTLEGRYIEFLLETVDRQRNELEQAATHLRDLAVIREQHERLEILTRALDASANAIVITDVEARIQWANPAFSNLTGYALAESLGRKPNELVGSGKQPPAYYKRLWDTILSGKVWHGELVNKRKNGTYYDEDLTITPVLAEDGAITHFIAVKTDISKRKAIEKGLRDSQVLFSTVVNTSPALFWMSALDKRCIWFNAPWLAFRGRRLEEELGEGWLSGVHPEDLEHCVEVYHTAFDRRAPFTLEYRLRRHDGEYRWILDQGHPRYDSNGVFQGYLGSCLDISESKALEIELTRLATTDSLTGLANRRHFLDHLGLALARHRRHGTPAALLMLDLDHFKRINDGYGHAAGDAVLQRFAAILRETLRQIDLPGRLGGEEFAVLLSDTEIEGARDFAERLRITLLAQPVAFGDQRIPVTVSIGVTAFAAHDQDIDNILARADQAMYRAKRLSRNRVELEPG